MKFEDCINDIFKTPLLAINTTIDVNKLIDYAYNLKSKSDGREFSNVSGWQSDELDRWQELFHQTFI